MDFNNFAENLLSIREKGDDARLPFQQVVCCEVRKFVSTLPQDMRKAFPGVADPTEIFFLQVQADVGIKRPLKRPKDKDSRNDASANDEYLKAMNAGKSSLKFCKAIFYWFCKHADDPVYASNIDDAIFSKSGFKERFIKRAAEKHVDLNENVWLDFRNWRKSGLHPIEGERPPAKSRWLQVTA